MPEFQAVTSFKGFPPRARQTPIPNLFFTSLLPKIEDMAELRVTLAFLWKLSWKKGNPRFVTLKEMAGDLELMSGLGQKGADPSIELQRGLDLALGRGTLLYLGLTGTDGPQHLYFLHSDLDRRAIERAKRGEVDLGALPNVEPVAEPPEARNIYGLYEQNIGVLTPLIMEELKEAEDAYPYPWIVEAFRVAVQMERRRWRYIQRVLEHWKAEGRPYGRPARYSEAASPGMAPGGQNPTAKRGGYIVKRRP